MGVVGLYKFMRDTSALCKVKISDEVRQYRKNKAQDPVIVVDGISIMYQLYLDKNLSCLYGGQLKEYKEHLEFFIENFKKEDVVLVFYFGGLNVQFNKEGWISKKKRLMESVNELYDNIEMGNSCTNIHNIKPRNLWAVTMFVLKEKGCEIKFSIDECDKEIAMYAKEKQCMGILANDTDFIIYDTVKTYTSIGMNLVQMTFKMFDKTKICEKLMLKATELPILASLMGNDYLSMNSLNLFHAKLQKRYQSNLKEKYYNAARYIRKLNLKIPNGIVSYKDIKKIARYVFHDERKSELVLKSLEFYSTKRREHNAFEEENITDNNWRSIIKLFYEELCDPDLFGIVAKSCYQESMSLDDFRHGRSSNFPPATNVIQPLREKLYGLLLHEKPGLNNRVKEWVFENLDSFENLPNVVCPQKLNVSHPGLISLYKGNDTETQWSLLGDIFNITPVYVKDLTKHLLVPALIYRYIKDKIEVEESELNALVLSAVLVKYFSAEELRILKIDKIGSRAMKLFNIVTSAYKIILLILKILKNLIPAEMAVPHNYQDGKLFHIIYQMSCDKNMSKEDILKEFLTISSLSNGQAQTDEIVAFIAR